MAASPIKVVLVTMDSHLSGAVARAEATLQREMPGLSIVVHAADEWDGDPEALAHCHRDIASGDLVVATMLFLDDHVRAVQPALAARRDTCDAMLCCMSAGDITRLTRLGRFDMTQEPGGAMALLKRLRGAKKDSAKTNGVGSDGKSQMKMLRRLPQIMRFIPGTAQDVRSYFLALQYWLAGSEENLANLVRMLVQKYAAPARRPGAALRVAAPVEYPDVGLYHPGIAGHITERLDDLPRGGLAGTVGLLLLRSYLISGNARHYDGVIQAMEARGLRVIPAYASGLDSRPAIEQFFMRDGAPVVQAVVSLTGFSLVGGPAYNDSRAAEALLARLDVPYVTAHPVEFQTLDQLQSDPRGLTPVEATMMVALPELDGGITPMTFGGRCGRAHTANPCAGCDGSACSRDMIAHPERSAMLAERVAKLVALKRTARAAKKVAIVLFNFPPNAGATGTAAYLAVFDSLFNTLKSMREAGFTLDLPADAEALRNQVTVGNAARFGTDANVAYRMPVDDHVRRETHLAEIEAQWGPAPGKLQADGAGIFVLGLHLGNVFIGLQPAFGYEGDPMRLLFEKGFAPTHAFNAFYRYLREDFGAHAVLHFGTHGALEFMPGKQAGLVCRVLAGPADWRAAEHQPLCVEQPERGDDREAPGQCDADQLFDAAGGACRALQGFAGFEVLAGPLAGAGARGGCGAAAGVGRSGAGAGGGGGACAGRAGLGGAAAGDRPADGGVDRAGIHAYPAWAACDRGAADGGGAVGDAGRGRGGAGGGAGPAGCAAGGGP